MKITKINFILAFALASTLLWAVTPGTSSTKTAYFDESNRPVSVTMSQSRLSQIIRPLDWRLELKVERISNGGTDKIAEIPTKESGKSSLKKSLRDTIGENREPVFSSAFTVKATGDFNLKRDANRIAVVDVDGTTLATITKSEDNYIVSK
jgi:hypothetical protein